MNSVIILKSTVRCGWPCRSEDPWISQTDNERTAREARMSASVVNCGRSAHAKVFIFRQFHLFGSSYNSSLLAKSQNCHQNSEAALSSKNHIFANCGRAPHAKRSPPIIRSYWGQDGSNVVLHTRIHPHTAQNRKTLRFLYIVWCCRILKRNIIKIIFDISLSVSNKSSIITPYEIQSVLKSSQRLNQNIVTSIRLR